MTDARKRIVVIGNGMVGQRFLEKMVEFDVDRQFELVTFCEEPRAAYDRVGLTSFFAHRDAEKLMLARLEWFRENDITLHLGDRANFIDRNKKIVRSDKGVKIGYDAVVLATGSFPFVPPIPGVEKNGVFVYRTIEDLERIIERGKKSKSAAVIGGGLLGLEAAKAAHDLGLKTHVIEFAPRLMPRQIDDAGSKILVQQIENLGVDVHLNTATDEVLGNGHVEGLRFKGGEELDIQMLIVSCGIRPRDDIAKESGIELGERGGVLVDDHLRTSDSDVFAIGEVALHGGMIYGLVAPGYEMAETVAANFCGQDRQFTGTDLSTKLKLMGVDVASFGDYETESDDIVPVVFDDPFEGTYKKLMVTRDGKKLLGGMMVGDASDYMNLMMLQKGGQDLPCSPKELLGVGGAGAAAIGGIEGMPDEAQVCSCNNVTKGQICAAIADGDLSTLGEVKSCTKAGTGCGGCMPMVTDLFNAELAASGKTVDKSLCEHFAYSRQELFEIVKIKEIRTFGELIESHGQGQGCEVCKPAVGSILASLWNDSIINGDHHTLQDTNDRFLANMQRGGLYSVVPRVPGGEITPDKLIVLGEVAKKYGLYTKITGGQRVDLFGAPVHQLPDIWEELVNAGFESGHAYGKSVRTVKSCVGTSWCRYGMRDSVKYAIEIEHRYRGIRSPHKLKFAVSGCVRECAEAQCKDIGLVATEHGYNLYVCGNGGAKPRHADLLIADIDEETAIKYIDRVLMYYIQTADKLTRTSVWLEKMDGGIEYLKRVVLEDSLGICDELEVMMQRLVDTYECEWKKVVEDPEKRALFKQFLNTDESEFGIEMVDERGQQRPDYWQKDAEMVSVSEIALPDGQTIGDLDRQTDWESLEWDWVPAGKVWEYPQDGGRTIKHGNVQVAVFNFASRGEWYACQNMCPHKRAFVLSRGIVGDVAGTPKVACPLHKKQFSLASGECLTADTEDIKVFPVMVDGDDVLVKLPPIEELDAVLATGNFCAGESCASVKSTAATKNEEPVFAV